MIARGVPLVPEGAQLVANGKQALSLVAQDLRARGVRTLLAPDFHCLTMLEPFQLEGIDVRLVATDDHALLEAGALSEQLEVGSHQAVLHCETYGARADATLRAVLAHARSAGVPVVVDATHSVFASAHDPHDYLVASLRKLLPLPDGAFVTGTPSLVTQLRRPSDEQATHLALRAAQRRRDFCDGRGPLHAYLEALDAAEDAMLDAREPVGMSSAALRALENAEVHAMREARLANARYLMQRLTACGFEVLNPETPECGVVVRVDDEEATLVQLAAEGIVCPITWSRPSGLAAGVRWRTGWVTLPVEPELRCDHLHRTASILELHVPSGPVGTTAG